MSEDAFVELVTADQPDAPAYFTYDAVLNAASAPRSTRRSSASCTPLPLDRVLALQRDGAQVLDTREPADFAAAHLAGSINVGLGGAVRDVGRHAARATTGRSSSSPTRAASTKRPCASAASGSITSPAT